MKKNFIFIWFIFIFLPIKIYSLDEDKFNQAVERYLAGDLESSAVILDSIWVEEKKNEKVRKFFTGVLNEMAEKYYALKNFESLKVIVDKLRKVSPQDAKKWEKFLPIEKKEQKEKSKRPAQNEEIKKKKVEIKKTEKKENKKPKKKRSLKNKLKKKKRKILRKKRIEKVEKKSIKRQSEVKKEKEDKSKKGEFNINYNLYQKRDNLIYYIIFAVGLAFLGSAVFFYFMFQKHQKKIQEEKEKLKQELEKKQKEKEFSLKRELDRLKLALDEERRKELEKRRIEIEKRRIEEEKKRQIELENKIKTLEERIREEKKVEEILKKEEKIKVHEKKEDKKLDDIWKIKRVDIPISYTELEKMTKSDLKSLRIHGLWALGEKGGRIAVDIINDILKNESLSFEERRESLKALKKIIGFDDTPKELKLRIEDILRKERRKGWIV